MLTTGRAGYGDYNVLWSEISLRKELVFCSREILEDELLQHITDLRFDPHIAIFCKSCLGTEETAQLQESTAHTKLGCLVAEGITLRAKKENPRDPPAQIESWNFSSQN